MSSVYDSSSSLPIGSRSINANINSAGVTCVVEGEWAPDKKTREIRRNDVNGDASDFQIRTEPTEFPVTLQVPNSAVLTPNLGALFVNAAGDGVNYVAKMVKRREVQGGFGLFDVTLRSETTPSV